MSSTAAVELAGEFSAERIAEAVAHARWKASRNQCDNPGGFIREALRKKYQPPPAIAEEVRAAATGQARADHLPEHAQEQLEASREAERQFREKLAADEARDLADLNTLSDEALAIAMQQAISNAPQPYLRTVFAKFDAAALRAGKGLSFRAEVLIAAGLRLPRDKAAEGRSDEGTKGRRDGSLGPSVPLSLCRFVPVSDGGSPQTPPLVSQEKA